MARIVLCAAALGVLAAGCGGGTKTVTRTQTQGTATTTTPLPTITTTGNQGPRYFELPSHNIGCYVDAQSARCDIRQRTWSPPPEPRYCIKAGVDFGQGLVVGPHRAEFVCAGDTALGGKAVLGYGRTAQRGAFACQSATNGITCTNVDTRHGFFLSRQSYRIF